MNSVQVSAWCWETGTPFFVPEAVDMLESVVKPTWKAFEWGAGASTIWLARSVGWSVTVEHNCEWYQKVSNRLEEEGLGHTEMALIPLGASSDAYVRAVDLVDDESLDLVFVDGRLRVYCIAHAVSKLKPGGILVLDNSNRVERYRRALELLSDWRSETFVHPTIQRWSTTIFWKGVLQ